MKACWDATGFYFAYDVKDADDKITKAKSGDFWEGDAVELWVDTLNAKDKGRTACTYQFWAWPDGAANDPTLVAGEAVRYGTRGLRRLQERPDPDRVPQDARRVDDRGARPRRAVRPPRRREIDMRPGRIVGMNLSICTGTPLYYYWAGTSDVRTSLHADTWGDALLAGSDGKLECVERLAGELKPGTTATPSPPSASATSSASASPTPT